MHSIPRVITVEDGRLLQRPIPELETLRRQEQSFHDRVVAPGSTGALEGVTGDALEIVATFERGDTGRFGLKVRASTDGKTGVPIWFDAGTGEFGVADVRTHSDLDAKEPVQMHVFVDRSVVEVYLNGNALTKVAYLDPGAQGVEAFAEGGTRVLEDAIVWKMDSLWSIP